MTFHASHSKVSLSYCRNSKISSFNKLWIFFVFSCYEKSTKENFFQRAIPHINVAFPPFRRCLFVWFSILIQQSLLNHIFLLWGHRTQTPFSRISVPFHDDALDFRYNSMIASHHCCRSHQRDRQANGFTFGSDDNNFLIHFDSVFIAKHTRQKNLGSITNCVNL